jgi:nuclear pore complex protein Nup54
MVPVLATGFEDIKKRIDSQSQACRQHLYKLSEAATRLETVKRKHHLDTLIRLEEFKRRELEYFHRVLKVRRNGIVCVCEIE